MTYEMAVLCSPHRLYIYFFFENEHLTRVALREERVFLHSLLGVGEVPIPSKQNTRTESTG